MGVGHHALVLKKTSFAIHPVPVVDGVERIEKWFIVGEKAVAGFALTVVVDLIEGFEAVFVEEKGGGVDWEGTFAQGGWAVHSRGPRFLNIITGRKMLNQESPLP